MECSERESRTELIRGERRRDRRYHIQLELRWKLIRRKKVLEAGVGRTIDLSSSGMLFDAARELIPGFNVELSISWPVLLRDITPMQLVVTGRILRVHGSRVAIRVNQHEFRTVGVNGEQRQPVPAPPPRNGAGLWGTATRNFGRTV